MLFLMHRNYLSQGIVTYIGDPRVAAQTQVPPSVRELLTPLKDHEAILQEFQRLESLRPITFERQAKEVTGIWSQPQDISRIIPEIHYFRELRIDTYFEVVTETYLTDDTTLYITEKTLRPIFRFQPFIHIGTPYVLRELRRMGFRTFAPLVDESYDAIVDPVERMAAILEQVDRLCRLTKVELHEAYCGMWDTLEHNFNHLVTCIPALFMQDVEDRVLDRLACP
jgi:hypothetical protein